MSVFMNQLQNVRSPQRPQSGRSEANGRPPRTDNICVGEELRIAVDVALKKFRYSEDQKEMEFPSSLTAKERAYIHLMCPQLGLVSKSKGKGSGRYLTIRKKAGLVAPSHGSLLSMARNSHYQISSMLQRLPLTNRERHEVQARTTRQQPTDAWNRDLIKTATGRLNNGIQQIPPARSPSELEHFRQILPVFAFQDAIVKAIAENKVIIISGETGSGKTTQVPQMILDAHHARNEPCRVFCTQPRRISVLSVAERVAAERGEKLGHTVGYQIRLESKVSPKTLLTFCTNGVLLRTLMGGDSALGSVTHVIVDEIHERDRFSDFILVVLRDVLPRYPNLRLVLMSAAINIPLFVDYFEGCPSLHIPGRLFDVDQFFLEDVLKVTNHCDTIKCTGKSKRDIARLNQWCSVNPDHVGSQIKTLTHNGEAADCDPGLDGEVCVSERGQAAELEPAVVQEMDELLSDLALSGTDAGFSQIFNLILNEGVSVDYAHSTTSATPLMLAAGRGFLQQVEQLLSLGAQPHRAASNGWAAPDWARNFGQQEILELLEVHSAGGGQATRDEQKLVAQQAAELSENDKNMLSTYHASFDDDKVDLDLLLSLLRHLHENEAEGAVLIFLPGYEDIVQLRDRIHDDSVMSRHKYVLYMLHSSLQSMDQKKVFKTPAPGTRKIILSTNLAETSITINDVVYVIDSGKVKEKSFDALTNMSTLQVQWISRASALQRRGRAGRCRSGKCFSLYSQVRYENMQEYQDPEILRYPLQELCLHTKRLTAISMPIADFLSRCVQPPAFLITRNAVRLLKTMGALDQFEDLTEVGHHMSDLPVEPRYSKMILYSVVLKCLDPVLTIACALTTKDPFMLPSDPAHRRQAGEARAKFASGTFSDHMVLLRAFQAWQKARTEGWEHSFCHKNYISSATMEMIIGIRTQLLGQLRASNFVRARGVGDIRDLNTNSENWAAVKAAVCAGSYPNVARRNGRGTAFDTITQDKVRLHFSSTLSPAKSSVKHAAAVAALPSDWLMFEEMTRSTHLSSLRMVSVVSPMTVALFAGPSKLALEDVRDAEGGDGAEDADHPEEAGSNSEQETEEENRSPNLRLDDWLQFYTDPDTARLVCELRMKWNALLVRRMRAPSKAPGPGDDQIVKGVIDVLTNEEQTLGLQQPAGIGQRPKPMNTDSLMSHGGWRSDEANWRAGGRGDQSDECGRGGAAKTRAAQGRSENGDWRNSNVRSAAHTPAHTPGRPVGPEDNSPHYFIMKAANHKLLDISLYHNVWAANVTIDRRLQQTIKSGPVYLVFSVHGSGHFQGYARMIKGKQFTEHVPELAGFNNWPLFCIEWVKRANLPFQQCHHLSNSWNEDKRVQVSRDGQEVEPTVGLRLVRLFDKLPSHTPGQSSAPTAGMAHMTLRPPTQPYYQAPGYGAGPATMGQRLYRAPSGPSRGEYSGQYRT